MSAITEQKFDVVIIGAGIIGCSIAYHLARDSRGSLKIAVLDKGSIGSEASSGAAGMLAAQIESEKQGPLLQLAVRSRGIYHLLADELKDFCGVDIQYSKKGILSLALNPEINKTLKKTFTWQKEAGLQCEWLEPDMLERKFPFLTRPPLGAFFCPEDGQVASSSVVRAFEIGARKLGVQFFENNEVVDHETRGTKVVSISTVNGMRFSAGTFIAANGPWLGQLFKSTLPVGPVKGQILIYEMAAGWRYRNSWQTPVYCGSTSRSSRWSCYFVPKQDGNLLVGATSEKGSFDLKENTEATRDLTEHAEKIFPEIRSFSFKGVWVGLRPATPDHSPVLGPMPELDNLLVAGGHFRNGILLAPVTGEILSEIVLKGKSSFPLDSFSPARFLKKEAAVSIG